MPIIARQIHINDQGNDTNVCNGLIRKLKKKKKKKVPV